METALEIINKYSIGDNEWAKRILKAEAAGGFSDEVSDAACDWNKCACGELEGIAKRPSGIPCDEELQDLGCEFSVQVERGDFASAAYILVWILQRHEKLV